MEYQKLNHESGHLRQRSQASLEIGAETPLTPHGEWIDPFAGQTKHRRRIQQLWSVLQYILLRILVPFVIVLVALNLSDAYFRGTHRSTSGEFGDVQLTYGSDPRYMSLDYKYDYLWADDIAPAQGSIRLPKDNSLGPADLTEWGLIGMFHSLHCLGMMRRAMQRAHYGGHIGIDQTEAPHFAHCFWYLRQAILCNADGTIELPRYNNGTLGTENISGVTDVRQCRSADKLRKLQDKYGVKLTEEEKKELDPSNLDLAHGGGD
ncbi:hypothetical protein CKM354_001116400 [Cercospora kikuchii]|uniref:Oxidase ustYa n=1 Tax=Cercospora kikuchii TaxID=84275 RepID=A0A9P3FI21_9PEZI|nr:uncharacterized protein CKM354_001116400 [Cercospora kikuchii]GIZ48091.1 hypothetical protein CKM354_001116400 [Cercospora kikuchii]